MGTSVRCVEYTPFPLLPPEGFRPRRRYAHKRTVCEILPQWAMLALHAMSCERDLTHAPVFEVSPPLL